MTLTTQDNPDPESQVTELPGLTFRGLRGESDYALVLNLLQRSRLADGLTEPVSIDEIAQAYALSDSFDPARNILIASLQASPESVPVVIGYSRVGWYSGLENVRLYHQSSWLLREYRDRGFWPALVRQNECRLREIAAGHPAITQRFFQAWASDKQVDWISGLESTGYRIVRRFNNMLHPLDEMPDRPLPAGFELRPVQAEHLRLIWEAQR